MDPMHDRALEHMTWTLREMEQYDKMLQSAQRFEATTHSDESYSLLAQAYALQGDFDTGLRTLKHLLELSPDRYFIRGGLADLYSYAGEPARALDVLKPLTDIDQLPGYVL